MLEQATTSLLDYGILGSFVVILLVGIIVMTRTFMKFVGDQRNEFLKREEMYEVEIKAIHQQLHETNTNMVRELMECVNANTQSFNSLKDTLERKLS